MQVHGSAHCLVGVESYPIPIYNPNATVHVHMLVLTVLLLRDYFLPVGAPTAKLPIRNLPISMQSLLSLGLAPTLGSLRLRAGAPTARPGTFSYYTFQVHVSQLSCLL